ncbi:hypothetical protein T459_08945 [Capsicum annuum]|uniref:Uncharacterized protein n=1 Tax=Capsicum annuum TaxID=4072 RepID=A0A2G2ZXZ5_CAPAN|nr:hypothetical protein T459_08945 [Capsicum annuum]
MDGKFYIIGGVSVGNSNVLTSGEMYDFKTTSWTVVPDMFPARNREAGDNDAPAIAKAPPPLAVLINGRDTFIPVFDFQERGSIGTKAIKSNALGVVVTDGAYGLKSTVFSLCSGSILNQTFIMLRRHTVPKATRSLKLTL